MYKFLFTRISKILHINYVFLENHVSLFSHKLPSLLSIKFQLNQAFRSENNTALGK